MGRRGRVVVGAGAAVAGIYLWLAVWATTKPLETGPPATGNGTPAWYSRVDASTVLRWAAVTLAVGGLMLATRRWSRGTALAIGLGVAWLGGDTALVLLTVDSSQAVGALAALVFVASAALVASAARRGDDSAPAWSLLAAAGVMIGMQAGAAHVIEGMFGTDSFTRLVLPRPMLALAFLLALAAGQAPASRRRAVGAMILAAGALAMPSNGMPLAMALAIPVLITLTGALPPGRRGALAFGALFLGAFVYTIWLVWVDDWPVLYGVEHGWRISHWVYAAGPLVTGAVLGALMVVATRFLRASAVRGPVVAAPAVGVPETAGRGRRDWRVLAGVVLATVGVAGWLLISLAVQPSISALAESWRDSRVAHSWESVYEFEGLGWDLRWACIVLAAAGLRLLANGYRRTVVVGVVAWFLGDILLVGLPVAAAVARPVEAVIGALVLAGAAVLRARRPGARPPSTAWSLPVSGGLGGVAILLLGDDLTLRHELPATALPAAQALGVALVVAAVVTALAAAPRALPGRGVAVCVVGAGGVLALNAWRLSALGPSQEDALSLASAVVTAVLAAACAWVGGVLRPAGRSAATVGLGVVAAPPVMVAGILGSMLLLALTNALLGLAVDLTGPFGVDDAAVPLTAAGLLTGTSLAIIMLLPRALSLPDTARPPVLPPAPPPPAARRPVALPGVPEVLEWPEPQGIPAQ